MLKKQKAKFGTKVSGDIEFNAIVPKDILAIKHHYHYECYDKSGKLKWEEFSDNIVPNAALDDVLNKYWKATVSAAFFVGLKDTGTPVAADTMASHASWATITPYSNATNPSLTMGTASSQSISNTASKAVFNINATDVIFGAFVTDNNVKGAATGLLVSVDDFSTSRSVISGDTLNVTITVTAADA